MEYDKLKKGKFRLSIFDGVEALPDNLIKARIALGWTTQKDLAERLKTTEQQIQKYESSNYESASLRRVVEIISIMQQDKPHTGRM